MMFIRNMAHSRHLLNHYHHHHHHHHYHLIFLSFFLLVLPTSLIGEIPQIVEEGLENEESMEDLKTVRN